MSFFRAFTEQQGREATLCCSRHVSFVPRFLSYLLSVHSLPSLYSLVATVPFTIFIFALPEMYAHISITPNN